MDITLLYFTECPNWKIAEERLTTLAIENPEITVTYRLITTPDEAKDAGFFGSPSLQVNGVDLFQEPGADVGLTCRRYRTPRGFEGAPTLEQLRAAIAAT